MGDGRANAASEGGVIATHLHAKLLIKRQCHVLEIGTIVELTTYIGDSRWLVCGRDENNEIQYADYKESEMEMIYEQHND